jgi:hypothetical protein
LGKVNYLRRFICNLSGKVDAFTPLLRLKSGAEFTWRGAKQQMTFGDIKSYLTSSPVLQAPKSGVPEDHVWFEDRWMVASLCDE